MDDSILVSLLWLAAIFIGSWIVFVFGFLQLLVYLVRFLFFPFRARQYQHLGMCQYVFTKATKRKG